MIFAYRFETQVISCLYTQCSYEFFSSKYREYNWSCEIIFIQTTITLCVKIFFIDKICREEKNAKLRKISPSKFTLSLGQMNKKWTEEDIRHFFETNLKQKIGMREGNLQTHGGMNFPEM
jgi:hypothetical protein